MASLLIAGEHLAPVHAACVSWNGHGFLLTGDSGAGKSSFAYACARNGFAYTCDDAANIVRNCDSRTVIGNPFLIRLRDSSAELFPELSDIPVSFRPNGKPTLEIHTSDMPDIQIQLSARVRSILFLKRVENASPSLAPFPKEEAVRRWASTNCYGHDEMRDAIYAAMGHLAEADLYQFTYSDLPSAVAFLKGMVPCL